MDLLDAAVVRLEARVDVQAEVLLALESRRASGDSLFEVRGAVFEALTLCAQQLDALRHERQ